MILERTTIVVSLVVPAYNEEKALGSVLSRAHETLLATGVPYELIVVDDGSTDYTAEIARKCDSNLISNGGNLGKGHALRTGFREAKEYVIVTIDADGENDPAEIPILLDKILDEDQAADFVLGSRFAGKIEDGAISHSHYLGNKISNMIISLLVGSRITDSQSGFRAFKRVLLEDLGLKSQGYEIETEMIVKAFKKGFTVEEVPITCNRRANGSSNLRTFRDGFKILRTILSSSFFS